MGNLTTNQRKHISKGNFAVPSKAPGSGSDPIENRAHAINALARASGKPVEAQVKRAVYSKYPELKKRDKK